MLEFPLHRNQVFTLYNLYWKHGTRDSFIKESIKEFGDLLSEKELSLIWQSFDIVLEEEHITKRRFVY